MSRFDDQFDPKYLKICIYAGVTTLVTIALGLLLYNSGPILIKTWELIRSVGEPFVYGLLMCYLLLPLVRRVIAWLERQGWFGENDTLRLHFAVAVSVVLVALLIGAVVFILVLVITRSLESVNLETIQSLMTSAEGDIMSLFTKLREAAQEFGLLSGARSSTIMGTFGEVTDIFTTALFSIVFGVYFLLDGARVFQYAKRVFVAVFGEYLGPDLSTFLKDADDAFAGYIRGQFVDATLVGVLVALSFTLLGVPYGPIIGLLTGMGNLIPYVGGPVGYATTIIVCLAEGDIKKLLIGVGVLSLIMLIDGNVINPRLLSNAVEVHPLVVVVALIAGSAVGGLAGMLIAVPLAAFIKVQLERWLIKREEALYGSTLSLDKSLEPKDDMDEPLVPESRDEMLSRVPEMTE